MASILNSYAARQPDSDRFRLWEVAGTAHADAHLVGAEREVPSTAACRSTTARCTSSPRPRCARSTTWIDDRHGPGHRAAHRRGAGRDHRRSAATPTASRSAASARRRSTCRSRRCRARPGPNPSTICLLLGSTKPFPAARLAQLYPSRAAYLQRYDADADATIKAGFVLPEDRAALLAFAEPSRIAG